MKKILSVLKWAVIVLVVIIVVAVLGRNFLVPFGAKVAVSSLTDLRLDMQKFNIGLFDTKLDIQGIKVYNPKGYEDPVMLDLPQIYVDYNLKDIIGGTIHLNEVKFNLKEFLLVKQADGSSNLDSIIKLAEKKKEEPKKKEAPKEPAKKEAPEIQIDLIEIKIGKFVSKEYSKSGKAAVKEIALNIDKRYENKPISVISADLSKYVFKVLLQMTMNLDLGDAGKFVSGTIGAVGDLGTDAAKKGLDAGKNVVGGATDALKNTTDSIKGILPFGK